MRVISVILVISNCVKSVRVRSFSGPYFPAFGLNTERYSVSFRTQSECDKIRTRKTLNTDTFHAVSVARKILEVRLKSVTSRIISVILLISVHGLTSVLIKIVIRAILVTWLILKLLSAKQTGRGSP